MKVYSHQTVQYTARILPVFCGVLFVLFATLFVYLVESPYLASAQYILSEGTTVYHPVLSTCILIVLLLLPPIFLYRIVTFPLRLKALAWFPSCWLLALLTCSHFPQFDSDYATHYYIYGFVLSAIIWVVLMYIAICRQDSSNENETFSTYAIPNVLILVVSFLFVGLQANTVQMLRNEMQAAVWLQEGRDSIVLSSTPHEQAPSRSLTCMRNLALSRQGELPERLFFYPQHYGVNGLLPDLQDTLRVGNIPQSVYHHIRTSPASENIPPVRFLSLGAHRDTLPTPRVDYYLCALLLERSLAKFADELPRYYSVNDSLPTHYLEAMVMHLSDTPASAPRIVAPEMEANYQDFLLARRIDPERAKSLFGNTYWYYYYRER